MISTSILSILMCVEILRIKLSRHFVGCVSDNHLSQNVIATVMAVNTFLYSEVPGKSDHTITKGILQLLTYFTVKFQNGVITSLRAVGM